MLTFIIATYAFRNFRLYYAEEHICTAFVSILRWYSKAATLPYRYITPHAYQQSFLWKRLNDRCVNTWVLLIATLLNAISADFTSPNGCTLTFKEKAGISYRRYLLIEKIQRSTYARCQSSLPPQWKTALPSTKNAWPQFHRRHA